MIGDLDMDKDKLDDRLRLRGMILKVKEVKGIRLKKISISN